VKHPYAEQLLSSFSIIISNARTKAKAINCSSLRPDRHYLDMRVASNAMNVLVDYSSFINAPHEFFDDTGTIQEAHLSFRSIRHLSLTTAFCNRTKTNSIAEIKRFDHRFCNRPLQPRNSIVTGLPSMVQNLPILEDAASNSRRGRSHINSYVVGFFLQSMNTSNATPPNAIRDHVEGSGTEGAMITTGPFSPEMKLGLIAAPVVALYSPTVLAK